MLNSVGQLGLAMPVINHLTCRSRVVASQRVYRVQRHVIRFWVPSSATFGIAVGKSASPVTVGDIWLGHRLGPLSRRHQFSKPAQDDSINSQSDPPDRSWRKPRLLFVATRYWNRGCILWRCLDRRHPVRLVHVIRSRAEPTFIATLDESKQPNRS